MQKIKVYKASAGSGKTFRLALEYLKLLLSKPNAHRNILAVSFTNKATGEMKQRILGELYGMAYGCEKSKVYLQIFSEETGLSEEVIRKKSAEALNVILHDYGFFNVETIDSLYQRVLRNTAKELGLGAFFNIELDNKKALKEAVRSLINSLATDSESLDWICKIIEDDAANEKYSKSIEKDLVEIGEQIFEEIYKRHQIQIVTFFEDKNRVDEYVKTLYSRRYSARERLKTCEEDTIKHQLEMELNSCDLVLTYLRNMGLLSDISRHLIRLNHEQNRFLLVDTASLLSQLIGEHDTSFLYEKIGANLSHILIDEFQDTSDMQWKNFQLLFLENLSKGHSNLIVGDVKQAIYRWRNSNWETLNTIENQFYDGAVEVKTLNTNYRTDSTIVHFNNAVFQKAVECLKQRFEAEISSSRSDLVDVLGKAYEDVSQVPIRQEKSGFVEVQFVKKDGRKSQQTQAIVDTVLKLQAANIKPEDIMILVRNKSAIQKISETFEAYLSANPNLDEETKTYFKLVSDEAFRLSSSSAVCLIIDALQTFSKHTDPLAFAQLAYTFQSQKQSNFDEELIHFFNAYRLSKGQVKQPFREFLPEVFIREYNSLGKLPLYELIEKIIGIFDLFEQKNQHAFLYDFLDKVNAFVAQNGSHINAFLEYWEDELQGKTITVNAQVPGIRILTIHKSKGLEFHTVVVPFCEWYMDYNPSNYVKQLTWHESEESENGFEQVPLIPLDYGEKLQRSYFSKDFQNETLKLWVDNLNLLYVALTRPKHNLLVLADTLPKKSEKLRVSNLLYTSVNPLIDGIFKEGTLASSIEKHEENFDGNVFKIPLTNVEVPFSVATKQPMFYISDEARRWYRNTPNSPDEHTPFAKGLLYHQILANIHHSEHIETTIDRMIFDGFIPENEKTAIAMTIRELLNNPIAQDWFSKKHRVFNECKIVNRSVRGHLERRRPDKVIQDEQGNLILVDFKTGQKYPEHHEQIRGYAALLKEMFASAEITGYLWYLDVNEIEVVELIAVE